MRPCAFEACLVEEPQTEVFRLADALPKAPNRPYEGLWA